MVRAMRVYIRRVGGKMSSELVVSLSVPSNYGYLSEGSLLRLLFDFLVQAGKTGALILLVTPVFNM